LLKKNYLLRKRRVSKYRKRFGLNITKPFNYLSAK
jgi:hypothetical protein